MRKIEIIQNCDSIQYINNKVIMLINHNTVIDGIIIGNENVYNSAYSYDDNLYCCMNSTLNRIEENNLIEIFNKENFSHFDFFQKEFILCYQRISRNELKYVLCDFDGKEIWTYLSDEFVDIYGNYLRVTKRLQEVPFTIKNWKNETLWQFNELPEGFDISGWVQLVEDVLFFDTQKDTFRYNNVCGLDIHTGEKKWELNFNAEEKTGFVATNVNKENNLSYGYGGIYYQVFDPVNGKMLLSKDMTEYYEQKIRPAPYNNTIADNRLWFVSDHDERTKFGAINIETSEMEFVQDYPLNGGVFNKPIFHNGKLYLLDVHNKELHIFENE